jgi:hypothetical protein
MKKSRIAFIFAGAASMILAFAGCGRSAPASSAQEEFALVAGEPKADFDRAAPAPSVPDKTALPQIQDPQARMVIKTASISILVKDVESAFTRAVQLAEGSGGFVQSSARSKEGGERADLTFKVPPDGFLPFIAALEALGAEESKSISGQDVTEEYYDLEGELENLVQVRGRLFQLLDQAKKVDDAIQVEQQLERIGANVNLVKGRMKYLQTMVGMSTVNLTLASEARPASERFMNWSYIGHGFVVAARVLVQILFFVLQALVVLIPLAAIGAAAAWTTIRIIRARGRARVEKKPSGKRA